MTEPKKIVRIAAALPAPDTFDEYGPFQALASGRYGVTQAALTAEGLRRLDGQLKTAFAAGQTIGVSFIERVKAIFFDMDATVIEEESIVELAKATGRESEVHAITERAMAGDLDFKSTLIERVALLAGLSESIFADVLERLTLQRGIQPLVAFCREIGVPCYMVSGGFVQLAEPIRRKVGFLEIRANLLEVVGGKLTGKVQGAIVDADAKRDFLLATCQSLGISAREAAAVGDGANDLRLLAEVGVAVGHKPKAVLRPHIHAQNALGHHAFLGPLLFGRDIAIVRTRPRL